MASDSTSTTSTTSATTLPSYNNTGLSDASLQKLLDAITESAAYYSGRSSRIYTTQTFMTQFDRFGTSPFQINSEMVGLTFFTRPNLNLTTMSLRQDRHLAIMDTMDPQSPMFAVRCNLDSTFMRRSDIAPIVSSSPWVNPKSAFNVPLTNAIVGMQGFPDFNVEIDSTEAGYFSESMAMVRGSDRGRRGYEISCTFRDFQGGYLMSFFFYWLHAMALQMEGVTVAYPADRDANRLNYTCSIYRFVLDTSQRRIVKWCKATGCYPLSVPLGDNFNFSPGDSFSHTSQQFTIPFRVTNVSYFDPIHLKAFNTLVKRYASDIDSSSRTAAPVSAEANFCGLPYIDLTGGKNEITFRATKDELTNPSTSVITEIMNGVNKTSDSAYATKYTKDLNQTT